MNITVHQLDEAFTPCGSAFIAKITSPASPGPVWVQFATADPDSIEGAILARIIAACRFDATEVDMVKNADGTYDVQPTPPEGAGGATRYGGRGGGSSSVSWLVIDGVAPTDLETRALDLTARLADAMHSLVFTGTDPSDSDVARDDWAEIARSIHDIQARIALNIAARLPSAPVRPLGKRYPS